jgi:uncharacterized protein DUF5655
LPLTGRARPLSDWAAHLLRSRTGQDVGAWNRRVAEAGLPGEPALRAWLDGQGVTGYGQALLVWERFGYPDFLTAEADELLVGQYADRPQLRPVLDAVLAALPAVGPATVQARKTIVSLVTPRRTFAVIQATTKARVDLGLRLEHERPGGRLFAARDLGAATVRIALTRPEDVDVAVLGWLRRAYTENAAPPPPPSLPPRGAEARGAHGGDRGRQPARAHLPLGRRRAVPQLSYRAGHQEHGAGRAGRTGQTLARGRPGAW